MLNIITIEHNKIIILFFLIDRLRLLVLIRKDFSWKFQKKQLEKLMMSTSFKGSGKATEDTILLKPK